VTVVRRYKKNMMKDNRIEIMQIDKGLWAATFEDQKSVSMGSGMSISYTVTVMGTSKSMVEEKLLIGLMELQLTVEDEVQNMDI
jgi:hypothetical protein